MSADVHATTSSSLGGRANQPGPRKLYLGVAAVAAIVIAVIAVIAVQPAGSPAAKAANAAVANRPLTKVYGHVPSWLKIPKPEAVPTPTATPSTPILHQQQGFPVLAELPHGSTQIAMAGPALSGTLASRVSQHKVSLSADVPGTFTVRFSATQGTVPLDPSAFTVISNQGVISSPTVTVTGGGPLPATLPAGHTLNLTLRDQVSEGDGTIRWSPLGDKILVGFFWTTEFD